MSDVRSQAGKVVERAPLLWLVALASSGVVAGHTLTYWALAPDAEHRDSLLAATGHAYWGAAVSVAAVAAVSAVVFHVARNVHAALTPTAPGPVRSAFAARLVLLQVAGYVVMEVAERLAAGVPLSTRSLFAHGTLLFGVVVQVAVGIVLGRIIEWLGRATSLLAARFRRVASPAARALAGRIPCDRVPSRTSWLAWSIRGPPELSASTH